MLVTVGIPTYNRPEGLAITIERICRQTYTNLEIIISDNCSPKRQEVEAVVGPWLKRDPRIRFVQQRENIGVIRNFKYLLDAAKGEYFMWAADDDELDDTYIEKLLRGISSAPGYVVGLTGYDVTDRISNAFAKKEFLAYLQQLPAPTPYQRMLNFIGQPEYFGAARILWGLLQRNVLKKCFDQALAPVANRPDLTFAELPIELRVLVEGNLFVVPENLFHVYLLPSSTGLQEGKLFDRREIEMCRRSFEALRRVVKDASLTAGQRLRLGLLIKRQELFALARVAVYYSLRRKFPGLAARLKVLWFKMIGT